MSFIILSSPWRIHLWNTKHSHLKRFILSIFSWICPNSVMFVFWRLMPKSSRQKPRAASFPRLGLIPFTEINDSCHVRWFCAALPTAEWMHQYSGSYMPYILMTPGVNWLTEQHTGDEAPARELQTHIFLSWFWNIYFTFILFGSPSIKFYRLSSHTAKVE